MSSVRRTLRLVRFSPTKHLLGARLARRGGALDGAVLDGEPVHAVAPPKSWSGHLFRKCTLRNTTLLALTETASGDDLVLDHRRRADRRHPGMSRSVWGGRLSRRRRVCRRPPDSRSRRRRLEGQRSRPFPPSQASPRFQRSCRCPSSRRSQASPRFQRSCRCPSSRRSQPYLRFPRSRRKPGWLA